MDKDEQIRSLQAQLAAAEAKLPGLNEAATKAATRADTAEARLATINAENTELRARIAAAATEVETSAITREKARADNAEQALRVRNDSFAQEVADRVDLEHQVSMVMGRDFRTAGVPARELMATVVRRLDANQDTGPKVSDTYLRARMDSLIELHNRNARSLQRVGDIISRQDAEQRETREDSIETKRAAMRRQGYEPLPNSRDAAPARGRD